MSSWAATARVAAEVTLSEGVVLTGEVHVQMSVPHRDGPETPEEMLNRSEAFFPLSLGGGEVTFVAKEQVALVTCAAEPDALDPERAYAAKRIWLRVVMAGGRELEGWGAEELPPARSRALDFLNQPGRFFSIHTGDAVRHVSRAHVRTVYPSD